MKDLLGFDISYEDRSDIRQLVENEFVELLTWWINHMQDHERGGFYGRIDGEGQLHADAPKGIILNTRILWTFAAAARFDPQEAYRSMADRAWSYLIEHFWDHEQGGVYWMLDAEGHAIDQKKQIYAQAFAIYAFTEYYALTKEEKALDYAGELFDLIEQHSHDPQHGGYFEAFDRNWQALTDVRLSDKDANEAKTMNTHLHILEAYTSLQRISPDIEVRNALEGLITCFLDKFIDPRTYHLHLFFDEEWKLKSDSISFGHEIECSWLLWEAAEVLKHKGLKEVVKSVAIEMADSVNEQGRDEKFGAVMYERMPDHLDSDFHWWPQAEGIVGFWNAWELSRDSLFFYSAIGLITFVMGFQKDHEKGEWHWRLNKDLQPIRDEDKAGPWKAPYHNIRMCLEILRRWPVTP